METPEQAKERIENWADTKDRRLTSYWAGLVEGALAEHEHLAPMMEENEQLKRNLEFVKFDYTFMFQEVKRLRGIIANLKISCAEPDGIYNVQLPENL